MIATVILEDQIAYLRTTYGTFAMENEYIARRIADIINETYNQGKRDKVAEFQKALEVYGEMYE